jgi:hypothetical protein
MVIRQFLIAALLVLSPLRLYAVNADDLRSLSADNDRESRASQGRAKAGNLDSLLPGSDKSSVDNSQKDDRIAPKRFKKTKKVSASTGVSTGQTDGRDSTVKKAATDDGKPQEKNEMPLPPVPAQQTIASDVVPVSTAFGVRLGIWMEGSINRNTSNAEPGLVEITLTSDIIGTKKTLKAGTQLFAQKQFNSATKRLELRVEKGITPSGQEFTMSGFVFDTQRVSGLQGLVDMDTEKSVRTGANKGLLAAAGAVAQAAGGATPMGAAAGATAHSVLTDQSNAVDQQKVQEITIYVGPQPLLIRVDQSF